MLLQLEKVPVFSLIVVRFQAMLTEVLDSQTSSNTPNDIVML